MSSVHGVSEHAMQAYANYVHFTYTHYSLPSIDLPIGHDKNKDDYIVNNMETREANTIFKCNDKGNTEMRYLSITNERSIKTVQENSWTPLYNGVNRSNSMHVTSIFFLPDIFRFNIKLANGFIDL